MSYDDLMNVSMKRKKIEKCDLVAGLGRTLNLTVLNYNVQIVNAVRICLHINARILNFIISLYSSLSSFSLYHLTFLQNVCNFMFDISKM